MPCAQEQRAPDPFGSMASPGRYKSCFESRQDGTTPQEEGGGVLRCQPPRLEVEWDDLYEYIDQAIAELPEELRAPVVAHFLEGESHAVVAENLGVSRQTVTYRIGKAIDAIRRSLGKHRIPVTPAALTAAMSANLLESAPIPVSLTARIGRLALSGASLSTKAGTSALGGILGMKKVVVLGVLLATGIIGGWFVIRSEHVATHAPGQHVPADRAPSPAAASPNRVYSTETANASEATTAPTAFQSDGSRQSEGRDGNATLPPTEGTKTLLDGIMGTLSIYFKAGFSGDDERAASVCVPASGPDRQSGELEHLMSYHEDLPFDVYASRTKALAVSSLVGVKDKPDPPEGYLLFFLTRQGAGPWLIEDIDYNQYDKAVEQIAEFLRRSPDAQTLTK